MLSKSQLKYIQSLDQKKYRDEESVFIAEGPKLVQEILQSRNAELKNLYALKRWILENKELVPTANVTEIEETELERISNLKTPNNVLAVFKKFQIKEPVVRNKISLILDAVRDPGNLGTIIRIADWFAIDEIICSDDCADVYNSKVVQATMGSIARVNIFYTDLEAWLKEQPVRIYGALLEGKDITKMNAIKEGLVIIGNESNGIRRELVPYVNERITIPRKGNAESLNAAIATGIILSHLIS